MSERRRHVADLFETFELLSVLKQRVNKPKVTKTGVFWNFLEPSVLSLCAINTKTGTEIGHHATITNILAQFYKIFQLKYSFWGYLVVSV